MRRQIFKRSYFKLIIFAAVLLTVLPNVLAQPGNTKMAQIDIEYYLRQVAFYSEAIEKNSNDAELYYGRGANYAYISRFDEALADYARAVELNKKYDMPYLGRGYIYWIKRQYDEAVKAFSKAIELNPLNKEAIEYRGKSLTEFNKAVAFIVTISEQLKLKPLDPELYTLRAETYKKIGKNNEAEADLEKFNQLDAILKKNVSAECASTNYDCKIAIYTEQIKITLDMQFQKDLEMFYFGRAVAYYEKDDLDNALSDFKEANKIIGYKDFASIYIGKINLRKGKYDEVFKDFLCERKANNAEIDLLCGKVHLYKTNYDEAFDHFDEAIRLNPRSAESYFGRGVVYLERARIYSEYDNDEVKSVEAYKNAVKDFDTAIEIDLNNVNSEVYFKRAKAYKKLGEQAKADADRKKYEELSAKP